MTIIMLGDVVGECGLITLEKRLPPLIKKFNADFTIVNGENAAAGFGLTVETLDRILASGADVVTSGNHIWEKREIWPALDDYTRPDRLQPNGKPVLRPANYPLIHGNNAETGNENAVPGRGWIIVSKNGLSILVINLQGRELMTPIDCPFQCFDTIAAEHGDIPIVVDFHAESTEEKETLAYYLDGRASIVAGTHTHVQTADERVLPKGTAYISDLGMSGVTNGIIGMDKDICIRRMRYQVVHRMECANAQEENCALQGIVAELDERGRALSINRIKS